MFNSWSRGNQSETADVPDWDKHPTATHYNPMQDMYLKEVISGVYDNLAPRTLEECTGMHVLDEKRNQTINQTS